MLGLSRQDRVTDEVIRARIHPQDRALVDGAWRASLTDDESHAASFRVVHPDGTVRLLGSIGRARHDPRRPPGTADPRPHLRPHRLVPTRTRRPVGRLEDVAIALQGPSALG
jgi:hypothetical protein